MTPKGCGDPADADPMGPAVVFRGGALGDLILTFPLLRRLARETGRGVDLVAPARHRALAALAPDCIHHWWDLDHPALAPLFAGQPSHEPAFNRLLASASTVVSFLSTPGDPLAELLSGLGLTLTPPASGHRPDRRHFHLPPRPATGEPAAAFILHGVFPGERFEPVNFRRPAPLTPAETGPPPVIIHPGSGSRTKNWSLANWLELRGRLPLPRVHWLLGPAENALAPRLSAALPPGDTLQQPANTQELTDRLASARAFLGHDSGVSHLAAALGLPCFLLFGPTDPAVWAPPYPHVHTHAAPPGFAGLTPAAVAPELLAWLADLPTAPLSPASP
ncbi:MAG: hypothetical protein EA425_02960 [Puniceicoccaceae bacterium]|nr:MAG: hypothetical protein EA425_02960 [Puniceicoccaceae bacterium]